MTNLTLSEPSIDAEIVETPNHITKELYEEKCSFYTDDQIIADWLLGKSKKTQRVYFQAIKQLNRFLDHKPLITITKPDIQSFLYSHQQKGNKPSTIKGKLSAISSLFKHCLLENYREYNPCRNIKLQKQDKEDKKQQTKDIRQKTIPQDEIKLIIQNAVNERDAVLFELIYGLGLRMHEALNLAWSDIYHDGQKWQCKIIGKGNKIRFNVIPDKLYQKMKNFDTEEYIFLSNRGKKLSLRACDKNFHTACNRAGLSSELSTHWLRHSHASHALANGNSLVSVRDQLGHSSIAITSLYLHSNESTSFVLD